MKKIYSIIILLTLICFCVIAFSACDNREKNSHTHEYTETTIPPTCLDRGYTEYKCSCGDNYVDDYVPKTGHDFSSYISNNDATYEADGTKTAYCRNNGCSAKNTITDYGSKIPPKHEHSYTVKEVSPTCYYQGYTLHECACGENYKDNWVAPEHSYKKTVTASTCQSEGYSTYTCSVCGFYYTDNYTSVKEHSFTNYISDGNATYEADGTKTSRCDTCYQTKTIADVGSKLKFATSNTSGIQYAISS